MAVSPRRTERLEMRMRPQERRVIERAAQVSGRYVSEIARDAAVRSARRLLRDHESESRD